MSAFAIRHRLRTIYCAAMHDEAVHSACALVCVLVCTVVCVQRDVETAAARPAQAAHVRDALGEQSRDQIHRLAATGHRTVALAGLATEPLDCLVPS